MHTPDYPSNPHRRNVLKLAGAAAVAPGALAGARILGRVSLTGASALAPTALTGCLSSGDGAAPTYAATIADARAAIAQAMAAPGGPTALTAALVGDKRVIWAEAFGSMGVGSGLASGTGATNATAGVVSGTSAAATGNALAPTIDTMFGLGSGSKLIAAIATLILCDRGQLELDAPLLRYLPDFRMAAGEPCGEITVRMLLAHSSGLPGGDYRNLFTLVPQPGYARALLASLVTQRLKHRPGEMAVYCNDGFSLLEPLIETVTAKTYADFVASEILDPLGMTHSRFPVGPFPAGSFAPQLDTAGKPLPQEYTNAYASGGLFTTASDMARVAMMLMNRGQIDGRRILSEAAVAEIGRDQTRQLALNPVPESRCRFGFGLDSVRAESLAAVGVTAWRKSGDTSYHSDWVLAPDERLAAVVIDMHGGVAATLTERILLQALAERGSIPGFPAAKESQPGAVTTDDAKARAAAGIYARFGGLHRFDVQAGGKLAHWSCRTGTWQPYPNPAAAPEILQLRADGRWVADGNPGVSYRLVEAQGRRYLAQTSPGRLPHYDQTEAYLQDLPSRAPLSAAWAARVGQRWVIVNDPYTVLAVMMGFSPLLRVDAIPGLPGYVSVDAPLQVAMDQVVDPSYSDDRARMCLKIPGDSGRDLKDLVIEQRGTEEWAHWGSSVYRPLPLPAGSDLRIGEQRIAIGSEGFGEWRTLPATVRSVAVSGARAWYVFDASFVMRARGSESGEAEVAVEAKYLVVYGAAGGGVVVTVA